MRKRLIRCRSRPVAQGTAGTAEKNQRQCDTTSLEDCVTQCRSAVIPVMSCRIALIHFSLTANVFTSGPSGYR